MTIDEAIKILEALYKGGLSPSHPNPKEAFKLGIEALKLLKLADVEGGAHTFKGKSVEDCILIRKSDVSAGLAGTLLLGRRP